MDMQYGGALHTVFICTAFTESLYTYSRIPTLSLLPPAAAIMITFNPSCLGNHPQTNPQLDHRALLHSRPSANDSRVECPAKASLGISHHRGREREDEFPRDTVGATTRVEELHTQWPQVELYGLFEEEIIRNVGDLGCELEPEF